ncbi:MAG: VIT1/CCC1 transporter family protein [Verrucomicrobiae bacterium]|nr:VIT1/CCC1 transporter family protein [Verrucomicrobiae bacterium]
MPPTHVLDKIRRIQKTEVTEYHVYSKLAASLPDGPNRQLLERIAREEAAHAQLWAGYTGEQPPPSRLRVFWYVLIGRILGLTFGLKLMERGEKQAEQTYRDLQDHVPEAKKVAEDEDKHEHELLCLISEERLQYTGSMVLGLNDALVELTGALAGLTLALRSTRLIALSGLVTGVAAALSMASSVYLSTRSEQTTKSPLKAAVYTGVAYLCTVSILILPYLVLANYLVCLATTLMMAVMVIAAFNFYICVARDLPYRTRFLEMVVLSFGVAGLSFLLGFALRELLGVEVQV